MEFYHQKRPNGVKNEVNRVEPHQCFFRKPTHLENTIARSDLAQNAKGWDEGRLEHGSVLLHNYMLFNGSFGGKVGYALVLVPRPVLHGHTQPTIVTVVYSFCRA